MEVVLDTNVAVSAVISPKGPPAEIIKARQAHSFAWVTSPPLLDELERTLLSPRVKRYTAWSENELDEFLAMVRQVARVTSPTVRIDVIKSDPADNRVLEAAVEGRVAYVVTGDDHLLALGTYEGVSIITPVRFVALLASQHL